MNQTNNYYTLKPISNNYSSWQPEAVINKRIQTQENIKSNWGYRQYMQQNGIKIMKYNNLCFQNIIAEFQIFFPILFVNDSADSNNIINNGNKDTVHIITPLFE